MNDILFLITLTFVVIFGLCTVLYITDKKENKMRGICKKMLKGCPISKKEEIKLRDYLSHYKQLNFSDAFLDLCNPFKVLLYNFMDRYIKEFNAPKTDLSKLPDYIVLTEHKVRLKDHIKRTMEYEPFVEEFKINAFFAGSIDPIRGYSTIEEIEKDLLENGYQLVRHNARNVEYVYFRRFQNLVDVADDGSK